MVNIRNNSNYQTIGIVGIATYEDASCRNINTEFYIPFHQPIKYFVYIVQDLQSLFCPQVGKKYR